MDNDLVNLRHFDFINSEASSMKNITIEKLCNAISITNIGTTMCFVNGFPLHPGSASQNGEAFVIAGNLGEIYRGKLQVTFTGNTGLVVITQKIYIK